MSDQRIHIIGGPGTGKTTLAKWLAGRTGFPSFDLDQVGWGPSGKVPRNERQTALEGILANPSWITEGNFLWWTDPLLENADLIIWLDLPFPLAAWRMIRRHILADLSGHNPHPGFRRLVELIWWTGRQHYRPEAVVPAGPDDDAVVTRAATSQVLDRYQDKVEHCRSPRDVRSLLVMIKAEQQR